MRLRRGCKGVGDIALTLGDGAMRTRSRVGAAAAILVYGVTGVTDWDNGVVGSGRRVCGASTGGGDGGRVSTEGARVDAGSVGVSIDVEKIS